MSLIENSKQADHLPSVEELLNPTLAALSALGGSGSIQELNDTMANALGVPVELQEIRHRGGHTVFEYRASWARTYLKYVGLVDNSDRGVWLLTAKGAAEMPVDAQATMRHVRQVVKASRKARTQEHDVVEEALEPDVAADWRARLLEVLQSMDATAFERLCQRILREAGFTEVVVTRRSNDGGIDGHGIIRLGGFISFPVFFQSKRYGGNVGSDVVRDFRGAMVGRGDKGLIMTTGGFTAEARKEATRDGAPPIDLIDGELLTDKLKELGLGVRTRMVEHVEIDETWFDGI